MGKNKAVKNNERIGTDKPLNRGIFTPVQNFVELITNSIKSEVLRRHNGDPIANLYDTFGYLQTPTYSDYIRMYKRSGVAKRIIDATVDFTWKSLPEFKDEDENANTLIKDTNILNRANEIEQDVQGDYTAFEQAMFEMDKRFKLLKLLRKADTLNCIGKYSCIVIGTKVPRDENTPKDIDINDLKQPLPKSTTIQDIAYLEAYSQEQIEISDFENDTNSPRFGLPRTYKLKIQEKSDGNQKQSQSVDHTVHYTRVIHIVEEAVDGRVYGTPRLEPVYNDLQDLLKVTGGSSEMYWLGAYQGLVFNVKDGFNLTPEDEAQITNQIENYVDHAQRFIKTKGVDVTTLQSSTSDPSGNVDVIYNNIVAGSNVPKCILTGTENGVYAGNTDQDTFFSYITARRNSHAEDTMIRQLVDRLIEYGYIPNPKNDEYYLVWPELFEETKTEKLTNAQLVVSTIRQYVPYGDVFEILPIEELRGMLGLDETIPGTNYTNITSEWSAQVEQAIFGGDEPLPDDYVTQRQYQVKG